MSLARQLQSAHPDKPGHNIQSQRPADDYRWWSVFSCAGEETTDTQTWFLSPSCRDALKTIQLPCLRWPVGRADGALSCLGAEKSSPSVFIGLLRARKLSLFRLSVVGRTHSRERSDVEETKDRQHCESLFLSRPTAGQHGRCVATSSRQYVSSQVDGEAGQGVSIVAGGAEVLSPVFVARSVDGDTTWSISGWTQVVWSGLKRQQRYSPSLGLMEELQVTFSVCCEASKPNFTTELCHEVNQANESTRLFLQQMRFVSTLLHLTQRFLYPDFNNLHLRKYSEHQSQIFLKTYIFENSVCVLFHKISPSIWHKHLLQPAGPLAAD